MKPIEILATVLEVTGGTYEGTAYLTCVVRVDGLLLKFKVQKDFDEIKNFIDKEVVLKCELIKGQNLAATLRIVGVDEA